MRNIAAVAAAFCLAVPAAAQEPAKPAQPPAKASGQQPAKPAAKPQGKPDAAKPEAKKQDDAKTLYGLGLAIARSLEPLALSQAELDHVLRGIKDSVAGKPKATLDQPMQMAINEFGQARSQATMAKASAKEKAAGGPYLAKMGSDPKAKKTPSGAIVLHEKEGAGESPKETDKVKVHYTGTLVNGKVFDSSQGRGPAEFPLNGVIKCWTEALQTMKVGGKAKVVCPAEIAYGDRGHPPTIPGGAVLTFEVELLDIVKGAPPAPTSTPAK